MQTIRRISKFSILSLVLVALATAWGRAGDGPAPSSEKEKQLLAILQSEAPASEKAITCKHLAVHGSSAAVPELAKLLSNEQLASWARIALEAIPGPEADEALRTAAQSLQGRLLIGTLNSIGVRRDAKALDVLTTRLKDQDVQAASAAAVALGKIGSAEAAKTLRAALKAESPVVRSAVAEGCVLCAERSMNEGRGEEAAELYDEVRNAQVDKTRVLEATRGAILARKNAGIPLLVEELRADDKHRFRLALTTARELPGREVDEALAGELGRATPERAALIVTAMADRQETVILPAVLKAAQSGPKPVRLAALAALGRVGDGSCLLPILAIADENDAELAQAAKSALSELPGDKVNGEIVSRLAKAEGKMLPVLIELVGQRRIDATAALLKAVDHQDKAVRHAALASLGTTVPAKNLSVLIAQATAPKHAEDAEVAQQALKAACIRMPDRETCAAELSKALERASVPTKVALLQILGAVGGSKALQSVGTAAKSDEPQLQDASSRLLGEWATIDAAPVLLDLSKSAPGDKYRVRALRGYIRIARQFVMPEPQRTEMCVKALAVAQQPAEQKLVLEVLKRYPNIENLRLAVKLSQDAQLKDDAAQASLAIAQKLGGKGNEVLELLTKTGLSKVKLEIVRAEYGAGSTQKDVTATVQKFAGDSQLISLPGGTFNDSFGGDPAPNTVKQLRIQYKINGKPGEATFAENALVVLPMPK